MCSRLIRSVAVAVLAFTIAQPAVAQQSLKWKFRTGDRLNYIVQQDMKMSMDYNGREIASTMKQTIDTVWTINAVDRLGNADLTQRITRIRIVLDGGALGHVEYDTAGKDANRTDLGAMPAVLRELTEARIATRMSPTGKILSIQVPPKLLATLKSAPGVGSAGFDEESLKQMFNQSGVIMPQTPVQPGSRWTSVNEVKVPAGKMVFNSVLNFRGLQDFEGRKYARIDVKPAVRIVADPKATVQIQIKETTGGGAVLFDHVAGRINRTKLTSRMLMTITENGQPTDQTIEQSVSMRLVPKQIAARGSAKRSGE